MTNPQINATETIMRIELTNRIKIAIENADVSGCRERGGRSQVHAEAATQATLEFLAEIQRQRFQADIQAAFSRR